MKTFIKFFLVITLLLAVVQGRSQAGTGQDMFVEKEFVLIRSTPVYEDALKTARAAAVNLKLKLDLRELKKNTKSGLSWSKKTCENEWDEFPCYVARGRWDDGNYVSIEFSDAYKGFTKGYYIVIIASAEKGNAGLKTMLVKAKRFYKDAYSKVTSVYLGCMH